MPWSQFFVVQELDTQIDRLREERRLAGLIADQNNAHLDLEIARARRRASAIEIKLKSRETERAEAVASLPAPFVGFYNRVRRKLQGPPWVVSLTGSSCPACHLLLPSKLVGDIQRIAEPVLCPNCGRLLIWSHPSPPLPRPA
jgi:predicted  nucleic acid-binding Zn-ribbon protein